MISHYISISSFHKQFFNYFYTFILHYFSFFSYHWIFLIFLLLLFLFLFSNASFSLYNFFFNYFISFLIYFSFASSITFFYNLRLYTKHITGEHINFFLIHENFYTPISEYQFSLLFIYFIYSLFVCCLIFL